ncbi:hypothetical protein F4780DRAFT_566677 [Xylariomycetidae sp. FL0641]|nr:hypothetical protein F4780DRAFT_566677 [Xylariomycetidae sp. FL0641]
MAASSQSEPTYTVFIRVPFPRGNFVDPPPVNWDSSKDEALWSIISKLSKTEIDWNDIASQFEVTVDFLLQQVAWLTERHASQVRAQMRKAAAAAKESPAPSPQPGQVGPASSEAIRQTADGGPVRVPSSLSLRKEYPLPRNDGSVPSTPVRTTPRPSATRTSSGNTSVLTTRNLGGSGRVSARPNTETQRKRLSSLQTATSPDEQEPDPMSPGPAESSSDSASSASSPAQSRIIRRPPRFQSNDAASSFADDDEDDAEPAFLPYRHQTGGSSEGQHDLSATLRGAPRDLRKRGSKSSGKEKIHQSHTSDSSASSAAVGSRSQADKGRPSGPLSPRRTMELSGRSPGKAKGYSRDSDGTPSMGSSFSDLDDASVTQSALEEALASKMQDGGTIGSLRGTISNAFRSRYLPK